MSVKFQANICFRNWKDVMKRAAVGHTPQHRATTTTASKTTSKYGSYFLRKKTMLKIKQYAAVVRKITQAVKEMLASERILRQRDINGVPLATSRENKTAFISARKLALTLSATAISISLKLRPNMVSLRMGIIAAMHATNREAAKAPLKKKNSHTVSRNNLNDELTITMRAVKDFTYCSQTFDVVEVL
jgi:hypothetical protein